MSDNKKRFQVNYNYDDYDDSNDLSSDFIDISSSTSPTKGSKRKKRKKKHPILIILSILLCVIIGAGVWFYLYTYNMIDKINRVPLDEDDLGITTSQYSDVTNIALLGIDSRSDNMVGRSDAMVIVTVDKKNKKIKLTSVARDTKVQIEGKGYDKLTHAYAYGRSQLAVKTLNQNFGFEIKDYVTMNFFELSRVIDYIGGVTLDVDENELRDLNTNIIPKTSKFIDMPCEKLQKAGVQKLSGTQAMCYARIRKIDSDYVRGNRQREVLMAMFDQVKKMGVLELPKVASMVIEQCETSLSTKDIMDLGTWAAVNNPKFEQLSLPNKNISSTTTVSDEWRKEINDFIFEKNYYSPEEVAKREAEENKDN